MIKGRYRIIGERAGKEISNTGWISNLVMIGDGYGLNILLRALKGDGTYPPQITKAKMGTGSTAPVNEDTDLETPTVDNILVATATLTADNELTFKFFASDSDVPDDTYHEFGMFAGDQIFSRSIITPQYVKASGVDTTVEYILTANS